MIRTPLKLTRTRVGKAKEHFEDNGAKTSLLVDILDVTELNRSLVLVVKVVKNHLVLEEKIRPKILI